MRYTKDGLSVNQTERNQQLSDGVQWSVEQGEVIESEKEKMYMHELSCPQDN